jgi:uncharacterized protein YkwD
MVTLRIRQSSRVATIALLAALLGGVLAMLAPSRPAYAADDGGFAATMLDLVNQHRAASGVAPLQWADSLARVADDGRYDGCGYPIYGRANDMGTRNYFSHSILSCNNQSYTHIIANQSIPTSGSAENIAWMNGTTDPLVAATRLTNDFMASAGHRANILNANYTHVGIGSWHTAAGQTWSGGGYPLTNVFVAAQVFGRLSAGATSPPPPPAPALPAAPTNVVATGGDGAVHVTWAPAGSGPAIDSYGAFVWDSAGYTGKYVTVCAVCRSATVTGLPNAKQYYVTVHGHNAAGWGANGTSAWVTVAAVPGPPTEVRAVPGNASVSATWKVPTNPGTAIDGHGLFIFDANGYTGKYAWVCATCTTATVSGLVNGGSYLALVYAHNPNGWGSPTIAEWVVAGTPAAPPRVTVTPGSGSVNVSWTPATNSGSAIDMYGMFVFDENGYTGKYATACGTCTSGSVPGLVAGRTYRIAVYAHNAYGFGVATTSVPVVPAA